ncbi:unnamed protein product [Spirodela intermedia]|uniref:Uncharacterized protein n=1 Tax=Spirodela intermedia TaxID=51605 RepID=A0A7I8J2F5_SPIIN|nr:unnamed protein product [Spirodela intermedia]CAA6664338.1 unnamed protein product [Spirodela intermedia]
MSLSFPPLTDLTTYGVSPPLDKIILLIHIKYLAKEFDIKTLGRLKYFMGIEVAHSSKGIFISQRKYIADLLKDIENLLMFLGGNLVTWCSKKQNVVAHSSAELEFKALVHRICELLWVKILLIDLKIPLLGSMKL